MRVAPLTRYFLPVIYLAVSVRFAYPQSKLQPGIAIERKIAAGQSHSYTITLQEDQYLRLVVEQKGIDLGIRIAEPGGRRIGDFDASNSATESVSFIAENPGDYSIVVMPLDEFRNPAPGKYEIRIVELRRATDHELRTGKTQQALRYRGVALLNEILAEIPSVRNSLARASYETEVSNHLWSFDEQSAARALNHAADGVREAIQRIGSSQTDSFQNSVRLRETVAEQMTKYEPEVALSFLRSTRIPRIAEEMGHQEKELELSVSAALAPTNPKAAFQIVEDNLKDGFSPGVLTTLEALEEKSPDLASMIAHDIVTKLVNQPLIETPGNAAMASSLLQLARKSRMRSPVPVGAGANLITEAEMRSLLQKMASEVVLFPAKENFLYTAQKETAKNMIVTLKQLSGGMQIITPDLLAAVEQRLTPKIFIRMDGDVIIDPASTRVETPEEALTSFHRQAVQDSSEKRNFEEMFQHLEALSLIDRTELIGEIVGDIGPGLKKSTTLMFLDRARRLLPSSPRAEDEDEMAVLLSFVSPYSLVDPNRGFEIIEPLIDQFNDLTIAAVTMNGFPKKYYEDGDFITDGGTALSDMLDKLSTALGHLALANFQRAKADADRIRTPRARIEMHLAIASCAISGCDEDE
jgi:hypothetical protein